MARDVSAESLVDCNTRGVRSRRVITTWLLVLAAVVLSLPAVAIASGPSAGDNQYTDPLAGQGTHHTSGGSHSQTSSTPQTSTPTAGSSSGTPTTTLSSSSPTSSTASSSSPPRSSTAAATSAAKSSRTLPMTGFDAGLAAAIGAGLIGIGLVTRRRIRCPSR